MDKKTLSLPQMIRSASIQPETLDAEKRTVDVVWSLGARVYRASFFSDPYYEELDMTPEAVDLSRLNSGAPLLNSHQSWDLGDVIGVVERAWIDNGIGKATVRFAQDPASDEIYQKVSSGIIRNVSVGYSVQKYRDVSTPDDKVRVLRAVAWQPMELSAVPIGADAGAGFRGGAQSSNPCEIETETRAVSANEGKSMEKPDTAPQAGAPEVNETEIRAEATKAERARVKEITDSCRKAKLSDEFAQDLVQSGKEIADCRAAIIDKFAESQTTEVRHVAAVTGGEPTSHEKRIAAVENAILHRMDPSKNTLSESGREFRGMSLVEIAKDMIHARGGNVRGMTKMEVAKRALESTSDLPALLANVQNKTLRDAYQAAPQSFRPIVKEGTAPDFKQMSRVYLSDAPVLEEVGEGGEIKQGAFSDGKEVYQLATYAKIVPISRQVIINDDLSGMMRIPMAFGAAASRLESDTVWAIITANAAMGDGVALFHATHKNLAVTASGIDVGNMKLARAALRKQKAPNGDYLNLSPGIIMCGTDLESDAEQLVGPIVPTQESNVNPFTQKLMILVDPRLDVTSGGKPWYVAARPGQIDLIEISYLEGQAGVYLESEPSFDVDGIKFKARLDFAAKALDWRGLYKNAGV